MSRRSSKPAATRASGSDDEFVMVTPRGKAAAEAEAAAAAAKKDASAAEEPLIDEATRIKGTPEEEAAYERALDTKYRADLLGVDLPPVAPPGYVITERVEPSKPTFWSLLFKSVTNHAAQSGGRTHQFECGGASLTCVLSCPACPLSSLRRAENKTALQQLYFTTVLMITLPLGMMALSFYTVFSGLDEDARLMWAGFAGVLGVNIVAVGFGLFAYYDNSPDDDAEDTPVPGSAEESAAKQAKWEAWEAAQIAAEGREDRERLEAIKAKFEESQGRAGSKATKDTEAEAETEAEPEGSRASGKKKTAALSRRSKKDAALEDEPAEEAAPAAAAAEESASGSRVSRSRSKKA